MAANRSPANNGTPEAILFCAFAQAESHRVFRSSWPAQLISTGRKTGKPRENCGIKDVDVEVVSRETYDQYVTRRGEPNTTIDPVRWHTDGRVCHVNNIHTIPASAAGSAAEITMDEGIQPRLKLITISI